MKFSLQYRADREWSFQAREHKIERDTSITDLGINFSQKFSWDFYIDLIEIKGLEKLVHIRRVMPAESKTNKMFVLVENYVTSVLCYGSIVWFPSKVRLQRLEKFEKCVKWICRQWHLSDSDYVLSLIN